MGFTPAPPAEATQHVARSPFRKWARALVALVLGAIAVAAAVVFVLAINYMFSPSRIHRPAGLPPTAALVGTPEHYEFIDCVPRGTDHYECTMFTGSGAPYATGRFRSSEAFDLRDAGSYWFDGSTVRLSGGRRLEPVEPVRFLTVPSASPAGAD
jgi:hypothetical protein